MRIFTSVRLLLALGLVAGAAACGSVTPVYPDQSAVPYSQTDLTVGTGAEAVTGTNSTVQYLLYLYSDTAADHRGSQVDAGTFAFVIGAGTVIKGFDQAVTGMKVGGTRRAIVPPSLAYGATGNGPVPPNAALVFDLALISVQ